MRRTKVSLSRRDYLKCGATAAIAGLVLPSRLAFSYEANEKVNIAVIAVGGRGGANLKGVSSENIVALCDVDRRALESAAKRFPAVRTYTDYRKLLETEKTLDAVVVSTPDHMHAPICLQAMKQGLHCYCEKPLTRTVEEAYQMAKVASEKKLVTHMGTPGRGSADTVRIVEILRSGAIGDVTEVHYWTDRPIWPQGFDRPQGEDQVPAYLDWENWIGCAPMRPYKEKWPEGHPVYQLPARQLHSGWVYHPFVWRGWWDFGTGALGDIAPHMWHSAWWGLELGAPESVDVVDASGPITEMFPAWTVLRFNFPAKGNRPAVKLYWYDGGKTPPADMLGVKEVPTGGSLIVGTKGAIGVGHKSAGDFPDVPQSLRRYGDMYAEWIGGIKNGNPDQPSCPFSYAGPLTEAYLLGNIALKLGRTIQWDANARKITNIPEANQLLKSDYRQGWGA